MPSARFRIAAILGIIAANAVSLSAAQAAVITNLDSKPQSLETSAGSGNFTPLTIAPNATYRVPGKLTVRYHNRVVQMNNDEEFAIWPNAETGGDFGPQMRETRGHGNLSQ